MLEKWAPSSASTALLCALGVGLVGWVDYVAGIELKTYPLYFVPVGWGAWREGRRVGRLLSVLAALVWEWSNQIAGLTYQHAWTWWWNTLAQLVAFLVIAELLSEVRQQLTRESEAARTDTLTGLLNLRGFNELFDREWVRAVRHGRSIALAYIDLDGFKAVNDRLGHDAGDSVLRLTADRLRSGVRVTDLVARRGGDEFIVAFPELDSADTVAVAEKILARLRLAFEALGHPVHASIGVLSVSNCRHIAPEQALAQADALMYRAKQAGGDRLEFETFGAPSATESAAR